MQHNCTAGLEQADSTGNGAKAKSKAPKMQRTRYPGIFKRGGRYVVTFRDPNGRQRKESHRTLEEAREARDERAQEIRKGDYREPESEILLHDYAREWIKTYKGKGGRGFRENTRADYERLLEL